MLYGVIFRGRSFRIAIEIISLLILFTGAAGAATQIVNAIDPVGDVNHSSIDIVQVIINKDSDIYTAQIIVNGNINTAKAQYTITTNDGFKDNYMIVINNNINNNSTGLFKNTSTLFENTSTWLYNEVRKVQSSVNGNTLNIVVDFSGIDLTGSTFRKAGANIFADDKKTLIEKDKVKFSTVTPTPTPIVGVKGDLNGNDQSADAGDLVLMKRASIGETEADSRYDLNNNGQLADAGDLVLMKRASIGEMNL